MLYLGMLKLNTSSHCELLLHVMSLDPRVIVLLKAVKRWSSSKGICDTRSNHP